MSNDKSGTPVWGDDNESDNKTDTKSNSKQEIEPENKKSGFDSLLLVFAILNFIYCTYVFSPKITKIGSYHIWLVSLLTLIAIVVTVVSIVLYIKLLNHILRFKKRYLIFEIAYILFCCIYVLGGTDYIKDIFTGTEEVTTNEFKLILPDNKFVFMNDKGDKKAVKVSDETADLIDDIDYMSDVYQEVSSDNALFYYQDYVYVKYYPNSEVLVDIHVEKNQ